MDYIIDGKIFKLVESLERISSKDSFTHQDNKIRDGSGAWEWHVGSKNDNVRYEFFGGKNFNARCYLRKSDLLWLMNELKEEYLAPSFLYRERARFKEIWNDRVREIDELPEFAFFRLREHDRRDPIDQRLYAKRPGDDAEGDNVYGLIRKVALPYVTFVSILKLRSDDGEELFYFKIFPEYLDERIETPLDKKIINSIRESKTIKETEKIQLIKSRIGQGIFRSKLLKECKICPITGVDDSRFLIASHIKPWKLSTNRERIYEKNGLLFTPTYDKLFDNGFISFTINKKLIISPWISTENKVRLNLLDGQECPLLPSSGREPFLEFHQSNIFKR
jgi:hypothetical protein